MGKSDSPDELHIINPATEKSLGTIKLGNEKDVDKAVIAARHSFHSYSQLSVKHKIDLLTTIREIYKLKNYIIDPHGAIGYLGLNDFINSKTDPENFQGLFLETAHPIKFSKTIENIINQKIQIPKEIKNILKKKKISIPIKDYNQLKSFLIAK